MMGRLLRWLRVLGVDTLLRDEGETVGEIFARAQAERRILLTRDRKLAERRDCGAVAVFVIGSDEPREQVRAARTAPRRHRAATPRARAGGTLWSDL